MIRKYTLAWFGLMVLAIINGTIRDFAYKPIAGDLASHQISTATLLLLFSLYLFFLIKKWQIASDKEALLIGIIWLVMTELFEFGLGLRRGMTWGELLYTYNIFEGQVWIFIPLFVLIAPYAFRQLTMKRNGAGEYIK